MTPPKNVVKVSILDEEFAIRSEATPEHTTAVAEHVDRTIREIMKTSSSVDARKAAILAALSITDELLSARDSSQDLASAMRRLSAEVKPWLPPSKRGD